MGVSELSRPFLIDQTTCSYAYVADEATPMAMGMADVAKLECLEGARHMGTCSLEQRWVNRVCVVSGEEESTPEDGDAGILLLIESPRATLVATLISRCAQRPEIFAGILLPGESAVPEAWDFSSHGPLVALANHVPILVLPPDVTCASVAGQLILLIERRRYEMIRRGIDMYRHLAEVVIAGGGDEAVSRGLARLLGMLCVLTDDAFVPLHVSAGAGETVIDDLGNPALAEVRQQMGALLAVRRKPFSSTAPPVVVVCGREAVYVSAPVVLRGQITGYVVVRDGLEALDGLVAIAVGRAAAVCSINEARKRATLETEMRMRGDFLEEVFTNPLLPPEILQRRAQYLGCELTGSYVAVIFDIDHLSAYQVTGDDREARLQTLKERFVRSVTTSVSAANSPALLWAHSDCVVVALPVDPAWTSARLRGHIEQLRRTIQRPLAGQVTISAAAGHMRPSLPDLRNSYREALEAHGVGLAVYGPDRTTLFRDLGVYRLLFHLRDVAEVQPFYADSLAPLVDYDETNGTELVATLECFLSCHGNVSRTAAQLHLHRNGLLYRMQRIRHLTGIDLEDAEQRLILHLGVLMRPFVDPARKREGKASAMHS